MGDCDMSNVCSENKQCISPTSTECKCKEGFLESGDNCIDINECLTPGSCDQNAKCINSLGSYRPSLASDNLSSYWSLQFFSQEGPTPLLLCFWLRSLHTHKI